MSKIKIDEIEAVTTNGDFTITPNGSGVFEVANSESEASIQLNSVGNTNKVKVRSPSSSVAQNYTMILPTSSPTADTFLKVNTISGSGSTAEGQLSFSTVSNNPTSVPASNISSGVVPADRFGTVLPAAQGGLQFISKSTVGATSVSQIIISGFEDNTKYLLIGKNISANGNLGEYPIYAEPLQANDTSIANQVTYEVFYDNTDTAASDSGAYRYLFHTGLSHSKLGFIAEISNLSSYGSFLARGYTPQYDDNKMELYGSFKIADTRIHKLKLIPYTAGREFTQNTQILLYKYLES